ncbi:MAG: Mur ligase family protein [Candidatus Spechtbacterales bacterium]
MIILLLIALVFWAVVVTKYLLFWIFLWQLKEYRIDRMRAHFALPSSRSLLVNRRAVLLVLLAAGGSVAALQVSQSFWYVGLVVAAILWYGFLAARTGEQIQNRVLKAPVFTLRALVTLGLAVVGYGVVTFAFLLLARDWLLPWFFVSDLLVPIMATLGVFLFAPVARYLKRRTLARAKAKRAGLDRLLVIGITGSYGKTSMKEFLATILSQNFNVLKTEENNNTDIGVARTILNGLSKEHDIFVAEMGAYKKGEIARTAEIAQPSIGIITGLAPQHLALFGSFQNIQEAKYELIEALPEKGLAVFNGDNEHVRAMFRQCERPKRLYSAAGNNKKFGDGIMVESVRQTSDGMELSIREGSMRATLRTSLLGKHNVTNLVGAITVARSLGMEYEDIKAGVEAIVPPPHALTTHRGIKESTVIDDTYTANMTGVLAALDVLAAAPARQKIFIMQPLIEMGPLAEKAHREIGARIGEVCDWCIVTSEDYYQSMYKEALEGGMAPEAMVAIPSPRAALRKAQEVVDSGDVILLEGRVPEELLRGLVIHTSVPDER